jgi:hypothetical protein
MHALEKSTVKGVYDMHLQSLWAKYGETLFLVLFMANLPIYFWIWGTLNQLILEKQDDRIPELLWIMIPNKDKYMDLATSLTPQEINTGVNWKYIVFGIGLILPVIVLSSYEMTLGKRLAIVLAGVGLFALEMAIFRWLIRPRPE